MYLWPLVVLAAACGRVHFEAADRLGDEAGAGEAGLPTDLVAYYPLDDLGLRDASRAHDAACTACPSVVAGRIESAARFDGVDDLAVVASAPDLELRAGFTVAAWVWLDAAPSTRGCIATKGLAGTFRNAWAICIEPSRALYFFTSTATTADDQLSSAVVELGGWHHVAIRWDTITKASFLDGAMVASGEAVTEFDDDSMRIGGDLDDAMPIALFGGVIDDLRIYERALADDEVRALADP